MSLHFLLQSNLVNEEDQQPYVTALNAAKASLPAGMMDWSYVKLVPFTGTIEPEADYGPRVFPIGSTSMLAASQRYGWNPGVIYDPATFRFTAWRDNWGAANLINGEAEVCRFGAWRVPAGVPDDGLVFIRPEQDLKTFTGCVMSVPELYAWCERVCAGEKSLEAQELTMDTPVIIAAPKVITREWRTWVIGNCVYASSQYAELGKRVRRAGPETPPDVIRFAERLVAYWQPAQCFVLDVGELENGSLGLVEINTLNSSGIYAADMAPVYSAIARLYA